jgi:isocitrate/isopropylmalate dehydrogenase
MSTIAILAGDGIGVEITAAAVRVLSAVRPDLHLANGDVGAGAIRKHGSAFPEATSKQAKQCFSVPWETATSPGPQATLARNTQFWSYVVVSTCTPTFAQLVSTNR